MASSSSSRLFPYIGGWPKVTAKVQSGKNIARYFSFLIDSGADFTIISEADALRLGLEYKSLTSKETLAELADRHTIHTKKTSVNIWIDEKPLKIPVLVTKENVEPLLGRTGIFDQFDILFQESKQQVTFTKI